MNTELSVTAAAFVGRALQTSPSLPPGAHWLPPDRIDEFATRNRKALRYLNRGSLVAATLLEYVLRQRWPDPQQQPRDLALIVGTGFGNQGETMRYFRAIRRDGPETPGPMASYDVAVNSFVNFCSIFFQCTGTVHTLSSGAASGIDALTNAMVLLDAGVERYVAVVALEADSAEAEAYVGGAEQPAPGSAEFAGALLMESSANPRPALGAIVDSDIRFASPERMEATMGAMLQTLFSRNGLHPRDVSVVFCGPRWSGVRETMQKVAALPDARWLDDEERLGRWQIGATGIAGCGALLEELRKPAEIGLVVVGDSGGWLGAALLRGPTSSA